ncbi:MAG: PKD domain-containing protein, partial [Sphingobacteriales bacterium]
WKLSQVAGIFPNTDSVIANPVPIATEIINGRTYYVYSLQQDFSFANTGIFYLPLTYTAAVIENCSQTEQANIKIEVKPGPEASFNFSAGVCLQDTIHFTGTSNAGIFNITRYNWLFDDATTSSAVDTSKRFVTPGAHPVRYRIIADNGCMDDTIRTVTILPQPIAKFGVDASICSSDSVYITDTSLVAAGSITSWQWNFGDGNTEVRTNGNPFYHRYITAGTYQVSLIVSSNNGCKSDTLKKSTIVLPAPTAKFGFDRNVCLGQFIQFSDSSLPVGGPITQWHWNYGDGNTEIRTSDSNFNYTYAAIGSYTVTLTVNGASGCKSNTYPLTVNVTAKPSAIFTLNGKACIDSTFSFSSATVYNASIPSAWYWEYGDGQMNTITTTHTATHGYQLAATSVRVRHAVTFGGCASDTTEQVIPVIYRNPSASFSINDAT